VDFGVMAGCEKSPGATYALSIPIRPAPPLAMPDYPVLVEPRFTAARAHFEALLNRVASEELQRNHLQSYAASEFTEQAEGCVNARRISGATPIDS
jgi:hypothetical protein